MSSSPTGHPPAPRARPLMESPALASQAAQCLRDNGGPAPWSPDDAVQVTRYMAHAVFAPGTRLFSGGEQGDGAYMLLVLEGEVAVEAADGTPIAVVGPGGILGEMALLDRGLRAAHCTAVSPVQAGALSVRGLHRLIDDQPRAATRLLGMLAQRLAERLRGQIDQLQVYAELNDSLQSRLTPGA